MKAPRSPAARRALRLFETAPRGDRVHVRTRWWTAPLPEVEQAAPTEGRILEIGCGHGLLSLYLPLSSPGRHVVGADIDRDKIELAGRAAERLGPDEAHVSFVAVEPGELPVGPFDAVVVCDVLYLLGPAARTALLRSAVAALSPAGVVLVKETARTPRWKHALALVQEQVATRVLRITEGATVDFAKPAELAGVLRDLGLAVTERRVDRGYPHAHVLICGRPSAVAAVPSPTTEDIES